MCDFPAVPEVTLDSLIAAVLPSISPDKLDSVCNKLISNGAIQDSDNGPRWKWLPQDPSAAEPHELKLEVFKFFEMIVLAVTDLHSEIFDSELEVKFQLAQEEASPCSCHDWDCPDGFFYLRKRQQTPSKLSCTDMIMPMVFTKMGDEYDKAMGQTSIIRSMDCILDIRRRFVHGLTCESTKAKLWYHDRCDIVGSEEFDINQDWRYLVHILLSMLIAPLDRLGIVPDVELVPSDDPDAEPSYNITICNSDTDETTTYRTLDMISSVGYDHMVGTGTCVWMVQKLLDGDLVGPCYVLKDTWVYENYVPEHVPLKEILEAQPSYAQYFLSPVDHGFAKSSFALLDNTHNTLRRAKLIPTNKVLLTHSVSGRSQIDLSAFGNGTEHAVVAHLGGHLDYMYLSQRPRQHYRIVFKEVGKPVHDLCDWSDIFTAIQGAWKGLHAMHLCGYVHQNVSSGNILLVPASGSLGKRGVIMDLKYAKKINDTCAPHDANIGIIHFMATEVAFGSHERLHDMHLANSGGDPSLPLDPKPHSVPLPPFHYNPLHDMESIWWLCIWMMFYLASDEEIKEEPSGTYRQVFYTPDMKHFFISMRGVFKQKTAHLRVASSLVAIMPTWSAALKSHYQSSYEKQNALNTLLTHIRIDSNTINACYKDGGAFLQQLEDASRLLSTRLMSVQEQAHPGPSMTTIQPPTDGRSEKATKLLGNSLSPRATKRRKVSHRKSTQPQKNEPTSKTTKRRKHGDTMHGIAHRNNTASAATNQPKLSVFVELPAPKKTQYAFFYPDA